MSQDTLGRFIGEDARRDAIHVAITPVVLDDSTWGGGTRMVFSRPGSTEFVRACHYNEEPIGVLDPFLPDESIQRGTRCWLFLFPNTVTGMRHAWSHPAFKDEQTVTRRVCGGFEIGAPDVDRDTLEVMLEPIIAMGHEDVADFIRKVVDTSPSEVWLRQFAKDTGQEYGALIQIHESNPNGRFCFWTDAGLEIANRNPKEFMEHYSAVTGFDFGDTKDEDYPFRCAC